jgi:integrase/recombinase XerD
MKEFIQKEVLQRMLPLLDNFQVSELKHTLETVLCKYLEDYPDKNEISSQELLQKFLKAKRIEGCSERTLSYYQKTIDRMLMNTGKEVMHIMTEDLRLYLTNYQQQNNLSRVTIDNVRRILSSFFSWLEDEEYLIKSPIRRIHKVKVTSSIKDTYSDEDLEKIRDSCEEKRDLALIDMLASTGMRVGELVLLNQSDIDFNERECKVLGKGNKERIVYFDARTKIHLQEYLDSRNDEYEALFVTLKSPYSRLTIGGVESRVREIGKRLSIDKVHPHKFRRTLATKAIDKGMPIEQLQQLLGHKRIDTTLQYAMVKQSNVKLAHKKYIG